MIKTIDDSKKKQNIRIHNRTAPPAYKVIEKLEVGIVLLGSEVKAVRQQHADLSSSYVKIIGSEAYLVNAKIFPYKFSRIEDYDESRTRKLLLHRKEIIALKSRLSQGGFTLIPLSMYTKNDFIKLEIALVKGKKQYEKKRELKQKDLQREAEEEMKRISNF